LSNILTPFPPFRLDLTVWALRRRTRNAIDRWDDTIYRRVIDVGGRPTELEATPRPRRRAPTEFNPNGEPARLQDDSQSHRFQRQVSTMPLRQSRPARRFDADNPW